ncbi:MAG: protein translocase subunit SecD [Alphaproteobacteria bacterium]|nr:protein translocase subunit SecD [Alphaproteobacteria bacterium]MBF0250282.1 protein translocase subunit SecD [Alphaproteobacteria bacterium]
MLKFETWKIYVVTGLCALGLLFAAPNLLDRQTAENLPDWLPKNQINLGLDLQGGSHLLLEVEVQVVVKERMEALVDSIRTELRKVRIRYGGLGLAPSGVTVEIKDDARVGEAYDLIRKLDSGFEAVQGEGGVITLTMTEQALKERRVSAVEQSIEIVRRRIDETGVREPTIVRQGDDRILVQVPGLDDPERLKRLLGKTAKLTFHLLDDTASLADAQAGRVPPGTSYLPSQSDIDPTGRPRMYLVKKRVMVGGDTLVDAQPSFDSRNNEPVVSFRFDAVGAKRFGDVTAKNVGKPFAIVLDGKVISAPVIREPILGGSGQISGGFTVADANDLSLLLRAGALPAPLTVLEERSVGPGLGADSIAAGKVASIIGLIAVVVFMAFYYGRFGLFADVALVMNIVLIMALLSVFQATLTLPGIAGIVLTIGMAVDANVLVFERIREEFRAGRGVMGSVDAGYQLAFSTIIDANLTTLIAAALLFSFGSGPVQGFAVTLAIGIVSSMFTAIWVTRLLLVTWLRRARPSTLAL